MSAPIATREELDDGEPLVTAMTRPSMICGLTFMSVGISLYVPGMSAMITRSIWPAFLIPVLLLISYLVCLKDVYLFDIALSATRLKACRNKKLWGCRRYAPR